MSQDIDDSGELHFEWPPNDGNVCSHESTTARGSCSKLDEACCGESSNVMSKLAEGLTANEVSAKWPCDVLYSDCLNCKKKFFHFYVFSFRSMTSVDNNRKCKLKVVMGLILGAVWQARKITK
jgi:hypothetical protein